MHPRCPAEDSLVTLRHLPRHGDAFLLTQHVECHRFAGVVGADDPHRLHRRGRFAAADRHDYIPALQRERRVFRRSDHEHSLTRSEVVTEVGVQLHELDPTPRTPERELEFAPRPHLRHHLFEGPHVGHSHRSTPASPSPEVFSNERHFPGIGAATIFDLDRVAGIELTGEIDQLHARPRPLVVLRRRPPQRGAVEASDHVTDLEAGLLGRPAGRDAFDARANLVARGICLGVYDHADAAAVVAKRIHAERPAPVTGLDPHAGPRARPARGSLPSRGGWHAETGGEDCYHHIANHLALLRALEPDVASARGAGVHQFPHQANALLPKSDEFGVLCARFTLREGAVENGNAIFQVRHHGCGVTAQHAAVDVVVLEGIFKRCRLLLYLTQLGVELALARRLDQQDSGDRGGEGETAGPRPPCATAARALPFSSMRP